MDVGVVLTAKTSLEKQLRADPSRINLVDSHNS